LCWILQSTVLTKGMERRLYHSIIHAFWATICAAHDLHARTTNARLAAEEPRTLLTVCCCVCSWHLPRSKLRELIEASKSFEPECIEFQDKIAYRTGLGDSTSVPPALHTADSRNCGIDAARFEYGKTCFVAIEEVLQKTGIKAGQVNFVITNSSLFNPTPSLSASIINHFKMPSSTINYSLGGMGCSAGVIALDLARELLGNHPNSIALVVSHENITMSYYTGRMAGRRRREEVEGTKATVKQTVKGPVGTLMLQSEGDWLQCACGAAA